MIVVVGVSPVPVVVADVGVVVVDNVSTAASAPAAAPIYVPRTKSPRETAPAYAKTDTSSAAKPCSSAMPAPKETVAAAIATGGV